MSVVQEIRSTQTDYSSKVQVLLRFRPMNKFEISKRSRNCVTIHPSGNEGYEGDNNDSATHYLTISSPLEGEFDFTFDNIFRENTKQQDVFHSVAYHAKYLVDGYNSAIIAFGQSGSGKSHTMLGENPLVKGVLKKKNSENSKTKEEDINDESGVIPRMAKAIFDHMGKASPVNEFTVRVSYVEIYLEQIRDLLNPSTKFLKLDDGEEKSDYEKRKGPVLEGLTEVCCLEWTELVTLLFRGNSFRVVSGERKQTDLNQSHSIFTIKIEQRNINTGRTITSKMHLVDLAGSELDLNIPKVRNPRKKSKIQSENRERKLINRSHIALQNVMKALETYHDPSNHGDLTPILPPDPNSIPYHESKLTRVLSNALGGNCHTTFLLTASVSSVNIKSTMSTLRFGQKCSTITNYPYLNIEASPEECNIELEKSKKIQSELLYLIKEIGNEMRRIKDKEVLNPLQDEEPLWEKLNAICESNKYFALEGDSNLANDNISMSLQDEIMYLQAKLNEARNARDNAQTQMLEMEGECVFLRNESEDVLAAKKRNTEELIDAQNEIQRLSQRKLQLEHDLRTCRFREHEAITFARLFRRFYRNLLQNNAAQGSGSPNEVMLKMAGVPNLDDLIDIDVLMCESGLIEENEVNSNMNTEEYKPSRKAVNRSSALASKAKRQARLQFSRNNSTDLTSRSTVSKTSISTKSTKSGNNVVIVPAVSKIDSVEFITNSHRETISLQSPGDVLAERRIDKLERDLLHITRRCIDLQLALNESEEWVELLTVSKHKKKILEENIKLKDQLKKKDSDMQALVWKMNEIQIINKSYSERFSSREEHIQYLEDKLAQLQDKDYIQMQNQKETEKKLQTEIVRLNSLLDAISRVHWQDGKKTQRSRLESRIIIPFQGGSSLDPSMRENLLRSKEISSKTYSENDNRDDRTSAGISYALSYGPSVASSVYIDKNLLASHTSIKSEDDGRTTAGISYASSLTNRNNTPDESLSNETRQIEATKTSMFNPLFAGGKPSNYEPRRLAMKKNVKIRSATLRQSLPISLMNTQTNTVASPLMMTPKKSSLPSTKNTTVSSPQAVQQINDHDLAHNKSDGQSPKNLTSSSSNRSKQSIDRQKSLGDAKKKLEELEFQLKVVT